MLLLCNGPWLCACPSAEHWDWYLASWAKLSAPFTHWSAGTWNKISEVKTLLTHLPVGWVLLLLFFFHLTVEDCFISRVDQCLPLRFVLMLRRHHLLRLCFYYIQNIVTKSESTPKKCFYFSYGPVMKCMSNSVFQIIFHGFYSYRTSTKKSLFFLPESTATIMWQWA